MQRPGTTSRSWAFLHSLAYGYTNQAIVMAAGILLTPFYLRNLGADQYGTWLVSLQLLMYLSLIDLGTVGLLPREVATYSGREETLQKMPALLAHRTALVLAQTAVLALAAPLVLLRPLWLSAAATTVLVWLLPAFVVTFPLRVLPAVLEGLQDAAFLGRVRMLAWTLTTTVSVLLVVGGSGVGALIAAWVLGQLGSTAMIYWRLRRRFPHLLPSPLHVLRHVPRLSLTDIGRGGWLMVGQIAQLLLSSIDLVVIGSVMGPAAVVAYSCASKLLNVLANQPHLLVHAALPGLAQAQASESRENLYRISTTLALAMLLLSGLLAAIVLAVNGSFVRWWVGPAYEPEQRLTLLLVLVMLARHVTHSFGYTLFSFGYQKVTTISALVEGLVNLAGLYVLVPRFGLAGVPMAALAAVGLVGFPVAVRYMARVLAVPVTQVIRPLSGWAWRFGLVAVVVWLVAGYCGGLGPLCTAGTALLVALFYIAVLLPVVVHSPLRGYICQFSPDRVRLRAVS